MLINSLTASEADKLHKATIKVISESIEVGGTTIRDYVNAQGNIGEYALQLFVYGLALIARSECSS